MRRAKGVRREIVVNNSTAIYTRATRPGGRAKQSKETQYVEFEKGTGTEESAS